MEQSRSDAAIVWWGGLLLALGSAGVVVASVLYAASPPAAALPMPNFEVGEALQAALDARLRMQAAGKIGSVADLVLATGAFVLMAWRRPAGRPAESAGWALLGISTLIFVMVDGLAGRVLSEVAARPNPETAFTGFKLLFDMLFAVGTIAGGSANLCIFWSELESPAPVLPRFLSITGLLVGVAAVLSGLAYFAGINLAQVIGASVGATVLLYTILGVLIASAARRA